MKKNDLKSNFGARGWFLIIYMALAFFAVSVVNGSFNVAVYTFEGMRGWSQAAIFSLNTIGGWVGIVFVAIMGQLMARGKLKVRPMILVCAIVLGISVALFGFTSSFTVFVIINILFQVGYALWANLGNQTMCNNWFPKKKGLAIGWATFGFPLGAGIGVTMFSSLMKGYGIGNAYLYIAIGTLIIGIMGFVFFREYPEECGCYPDNDKSITREQLNKSFEEGRKLMANSPWSTKRMLTAKETWLVAISAGYMMLFATGSITQVVPRLLAIGYAQPDALKMLTISSLCALPGSYICGLIDQRFGTKKALIITNLVSAAACVMYTISNPVMIWVALVLIGIALGGTSNYIMSVTTTYWGRYNFKKAFAVLLPIQQFIGKAGYALVALLAGNYSYSVAYYVLAAIGVVAALIMIPVKDGFVEKYEARFAEEDAACAA